MSQMHYCFHRLPAFQHPVTLLHWFFPPYYRQAGAWNSLLKQKASVQMHITGNRSVTHAARLGILGVELRTKWEGFPFPGLVSKSSLSTRRIFNVSLLLGSKASWWRITRLFGEVTVSCFLSSLTNFLNFHVTVLVLFFFSEVPQLYIWVYENLYS